MLTPQSFKRVVDTHRISAFAYDKRTTFYQLTQGWRLDYIFTYPLSFIRVCLIVDGSGTC